MAESWTEPIPILQNVIPLITTGADLEFVRETDALMNARQDERDQEVDAIQLELRSLTKKLHHSITLSTRPPSHPSEAQHQSHLQQLDTQKFSLGKTINERQSRAARTEKEIEMLREEVEELTREREDWDRGVLPSGSAGGDELDGEALRLRVHNSLGFTLIRPPSTPGSSKPSLGPAKILVRNDDPIYPNVESIYLQPLSTEGEDERAAERRKMEAADRLWELAGGVDG